MDVREGYQRYPIRAALNGILPPKIQWRTDKIPFSPDYFVRYNAQLGMALEFVAAIRPNDPVRKIVDVEKLRRMLVPVDAAAKPAPARDEIPLTLYLINFLRQFSEFRA
jgi:asparagine synthase (glutamine-hydrolysing)